MKKLITKTIVTVTLAIFGLSFNVKAQSGSLDATFGAGGKVITPIGSNDDQGYSVAIQTDGKIVVAGLSDNSSNKDFAVIRYNIDGTLDNAFGTGGKVTTAIGNNDDYGQAVAIQSDGKIVVAGFSDMGNGHYDFALVRYNSDGSLDNTFDTDGKVTTDLGSNGGVCGSVAIQSDGKIVAVGSYGYSTFTFALVRYNSDGSLDNTFDTDGKVTTSVGSYSAFGYSVVIQGDGKIVVAGNSDIGGGVYDFALVRYNSDGSLDNNFDIDGKLTTDFGGGNETAHSVILQSDGKIIVAGQKYYGSYYFALARYNNDGSLDNTFGISGKVTTDLGSGSDGYSIALQSDGKIVMTGRSGGLSDFALVRYNSNGNLDNTFGIGGIVTTDLGHIDDQCYSIAIQSDGKMVVAGFSDNDFAVVRYNGNSTGIDDLAGSQTMSIYPNPTSGKFIIVFANKYKITNTEVYNIVGEKVFQQKNVTQIDISNFPKGIYFVKVYDGTNSYTKKIVVE